METKKINWENIHDSNLTIQEVRDAIAKIQAAVEDDLSNISEELSYYRILGLPETASINDVNEKVRELRKKYSLDKYESDEEKQLADEVMTIIDDADDKVHDIIMESATSKKKKANGTASKKASSRKTKKEQTATERANGKKKSGCGVKILALILAGLTFCGGWFAKSCSDSNGRSINSGSQEQIVVTEIIGESVTVTNPSENQLVEYFNNFATSTSDEQNIEAYFAGDITEENSEDVLNTMKAALSNYYEDVLQSEGTVTDEDDVKLVDLANYLTEGKQKSKIDYTSIDTIRTSWATILDKYLESHEFIGTEQVDVAEMTWLSIGLTKEEYNKLPEHQRAVLELNTVSQFIYLANNPIEYGEYEGQDLIVLPNKTTEYTLPDGTTIELHHYFHAEQAEYMSAAVDVEYGVKARVDCNSYVKKN